MALNFSIFVIMTLANYINDLLYRYDCVIVPAFGGFISNTIPTKVNHFTHTFYPPTKQLTFNVNLQHNDGLLANYIASCQQISFENAVEFIETSVATWSTELKKTPVLLSNIGAFHLNEKQQLVFSPSNAHNFLPASFGLSSLTSPAVPRMKQAVTDVPTPREKGTRVLPLFVKYAATAAVVVSLLATGWNGYQNQQEKELFAQQEKALEQKIQAATFVISKPLPTIHLTVHKAVEKKFHIIAGAFQFPENAVKKVQQLKAQGFDAVVLGKNKWGLTQVAFTSLETRKKAIVILRKIQKTTAKDAWLFVQ